MDFVSYWFDCSLPECEDCNIDCFDDCFRCRCPLISQVNITVDTCADTIRLKGVEDD